jgi:hypothetical protein
VGVATVAIATDAAAARVVRVLVMTQFRPEAILLQNQICYRNVHVVCIYLKMIRLALKFINIG